VATWQDVRKGTKARRVVELHLGAATPLAFDTKPDGTSAAKPAPAGSVVKVAIRPLSSGEQNDIIAQAMADAKAGGLEKPEDGDELYERARMQRTVVACCLDPDSETDRPFFANIDELRADREIGDDRVAFLFLRWKAYQDEISPSLLRLPFKDLIASMQALGGEGEDEARTFFERCGPGCQWILARFMARQLAISRMARSPSGSPSDSSSLGSKTSPAKAPSSPEKTLPRAERRARASKKGKR
jgi:hypothetical protein